MTDLCRLPIDGVPRKPIPSPVMGSSPDAAPIRTRGLRHLALKVTDLARSRAFYEELLSMKVVWEPDAENVYLSSGSDNLALHQIPASERSAYRQAQGQFLDHLGFLMDSPGAVDRLFRVVEDRRVPVVKPPKQHRDGSYSFYVTDPDGNVVQVLCIPGLSAED